MQFTYTLAVLATFASVASSLSIPREYQERSIENSELELEARAPRLFCAAGIKEKWGNFGMDACHKNYICGPNNTMVPKLLASPNARMQRLCSKCYCA
ncbi:hypothetical protein GALMADRAFT_139889 [Galerina marginata CBS 339.88]|uniref:Uncharacterized protein n=1 Tax=Galerina marginata (strain CBS 339.88) TaxID=685588 RepID=A0A067SZ35_GALM3|nr:hypothetical protein GALMADRAFT_139889 [Galerina marginata CBS 339.88]